MESEALKIINFEKDKFTLTWFYRALIKSRRIDVADRFISLWICFNSIIRKSYGEGLSDRALIKEAKKDGQWENIFKQVWKNPAFEQLCGYKAKELCNKDFDFFSIVYHEDRNFIAKREETIKQGIQIPPFYTYRILTKDGTMYFFSNRKGGFGKSDIYHSRLENGEYKVVKNLSSPVNSEFSDYDSFIAPDESYLIFSSDRPGGYGKYNDIYITFRKKDGTWTEPKNLGYDFRDSGINKRHFKLFSYN